MKKISVVTLFVLATLLWAVAQKPGSSRQATSVSSQAPNAGQAPHSPITEGCLGGSNPNFTITDKAGTTYKLNLPPNADASALTPHVGESVQVMGDVNRSGNTIDASRIGKGTGTCPATGPSGQQPPPKQ